MIASRFLIEHLDPAACESPKPPARSAPCGDLTHMHKSAPVSGFTAPHLKVPRLLNRCTARRGRPVRIGESGARCAEMLVKRSEVVGAASRSFAETAGLQHWRLARKCCATCFLTKPTIAGRCVCSRISSDSSLPERGGLRDRIGKSLWKECGRLADPVTVLKNRSKFTGPPGGWACDGGDIKHRGAKEL